MVKLARHAHDRLEARTGLKRSVVDVLEKALRAKPTSTLPQKFHVPLYQHGTVKGYAAVSQFGGKPTITTVLSPHMQPQGKRMFSFDAVQNRLKEKKAMNETTAWYLGYRDKSAAARWKDMWRGMVAGEEIPWKTTGLWGGPGRGALRRAAEASASVEPRALYAEMRRNPFTDLDVPVGPLRSPLGGLVDAEAMLAAGLDPTKMLTRSGAAGPEYQKFMQIPYGGATPMRGAQVVLPE
jgi:hypothetical protein